MYKKLVLQHKFNKSAATYSKDLDLPALKKKKCPFIGSNFLLTCIFEGNI